MTGLVHLGARELTLALEPLTTYRGEDGAGGDNHLRHNRGSWVDRTWGFLDSPGDGPPAPRVTYDVGVTIVASTASVACTWAVATGVPEGLLPTAAPAHTLLLSTS
jgi:hypothetical protein